MKNLVMARVTKYELNVNCIWDTYKISFMVSLWIRSGLGCSWRDHKAMGQSYQVGACFEALSEPVLMTRAPNKFVLTCGPSWWIRWRSTTSFPKFLAKLLKTQQQEVQDASQKVSLILLRCLKSSLPLSPMAAYVIINLYPTSLT